LSSAILYGAIVVIWAGVLIPRWLRREASAEEATVTPQVTEEPLAPSADPVSDPVSAEEEPYRAPPRDAERARVIGARRRLLGMLVALAIGAGVLAGLKLAAWWVVLPPSVMLIGYLGLLREASRADAERRWAAAEAARPAAAPAPVTAPAPVPAPDAEIIDITGRVSDEDRCAQVDESKLRAVGD
jgi:hypothetical protein